MAKPTDSPPDEQKGDGPQAIPFPIHRWSKRRATLSNSRMLLKSTSYRAATEEERTRWEESSTGMEKTSPGASQPTFPVGTAAFRTPSPGFPRSSRHSPSGPGAAAAATWRGSDSARPSLEPSPP
jgi:hypothetical protein